MQNVIKEARELADSEIVEINIIAQDSNYYLRDKGQKDGLVKLLEKIEKIEKIRWIRLMYLYPAGIDENLIDYIANSKKVVNYIDMPVQHINNDILKAMKRSDTTEKTTALIEKIRKKIPDVALRTTVIAGFPGETDKQFNQLLEFIKWAKFDALGCFPYYPEKGTPAAELQKQIDPKTKQNRTDIIMQTQQKIAFQKNKNRIGQKLTCLVDQKTENKKAIGRFYAQAPQIDGICNIKNLKAMPGDFIKARVTSAQGYDLNLKQL
jgi:ribosomal protein S12 methylthiotransferase